MSVLSQDGGASRAIGANDTASPATVKRFLALARCDCQTATRISAAPLARVHKRETQNQGARAKTNRRALSAT